MEGHGKTISFTKVMLTSYRPLYAFIHTPIDQSTNISKRQSIHQLINQSINQSVSQTVSQSINQPLSNKIVNMLLLIFLLGIPDTVLQLL